MADRDIPLTLKSDRALRFWLKARPQAEHRTLFVNRYGEPLGVRGIQKLVKRCRQAAGIERRITPHSLRHTFATQKARLGVPAFLLRDYLGHANLATTQLYVHLSHEEARLPDNRPSEPPRTLCIVIGYMSNKTNGYIMRSVFRLFASA